MLGSGVRPRLMEVRVTLHSSLSSWDERRPKQTKAKADGEGRIEKKIRQTKKSERNCLLQMKIGNQVQKRKTGGGHKKRECEEQHGLKKGPDENVMNPLWQI